MEQNPVLRGHRILPASSQTTFSCRWEASALAKAADNRGIEKLSVWTVSLAPLCSSFLYMAKQEEKFQERLQTFSRSLPGNLGVSFSLGPLAGLRSYTGKSTSSNQTPCKNFSGTSWRLPDGHLLFLRRLRPVTISPDVGTLPGGLIASPQQFLGKVGPHAIAFLLNLEM